MKNFFLIAAILTFLSGFELRSYGQGANNYYGAFQAKRGGGQYSGAIFWINWDVNQDGRPGEIIADGSTRTVITPIGITYKITITKNNSNRISSYTPGVYPYDDIKTAYNWYKATPTAGSAVQSWPGPNYNFGTSAITGAYDNIYDAHHSVIGIANTKSGDLVDFTITVTGTLPDGTTPVKIAGMVATGAESLAGSTGTNTNGTNPTYNEYERFVTLGTGRAWQAFTRFQNVVTGAPGGTASTAFNSQVDVNSDGKSVTVHNPVAGTEGPGEVLWYSQGSNSIRTYLKGGGIEAIAIGFVSSYDYGDAPESFGIAGHEVAADFTGGFPKLSTNNQPLSSIGLASMTEPRIIIGLTKDMGGIQWSTPDAQGDDIHDIDDEDGINDPYTTGIVAGTNSASMNVNIINRFTATQAHFKGWIDINQNGKFEQNERSNDVLIPVSSNAARTLNWTLPSSFKTFTNYYARLRVTQTPPPDGVDALGRDIKSVGIQYQGEVEDHILRASGVPVRGKVFLDNNKNGVKEAAETLYSGNELYAYALNSAGQVIVKSQVVNGQYSLPDFFVGDSTGGNVRVMVTTQEYLLNEVVPTGTYGAAVPGFVMSGDDMSATNSHAVPATPKDFVAKINTVPAGGFGELNFGMYEQSLPVTFGKIEAKTINGQLVINWVTEKETSNDYFDIMISKDGRNFVKLSTLDSKALNGNSDTPLDYTFTTPLQNAMVLFGISLFGLSLGGIFLSKKKKIILGITMLFGMATTFYSCSKQEVDRSMNGKIFVKIVQIDIDGKQSESKIVTAIAE